MEKLTLNHPDTQSADIVADNIEKLKALFPDAFSEGGIQFDSLKQLLGGAVEEREEKYGLNWHGKRRAKQIALTSSTGTLRPCPDDSEDWENTQNLMIEGDNLEVLKLLQKSYAGKIKLIYIDPPYNTGKDFIYPDDFRGSIKNYLEITGQTDGGQKTTANSEASGRFHTDWLNMIYPRLKLARSLLREDGVLAISIDDNEIDRLRMVCAEIFGEENFVGQVCIQSNPRGRQSDTFIATVHEYLVIYAKDVENCSIGGAPLTEEQKAEFNLADDQGKKYRLLGLRQRGAASLREDRPEMYFPIFVNPETLKISFEAKEGFTEKVLPKKSTGEDGRWMWGKEKCQKDIDLLVPRLIERRAEFDIFVIDYLERGGEERSRKFKTIWSDKKLNTQNGTQEVKELLGNAAMSFPKPIEFIKDVIQLAAADDDIILDFFAGSGTTGHAVLDHNNSNNKNCRYILVQLPELLNSENKEQKFAIELCKKLGKPNTIAELTKERLRRASKKIKEENQLFTGDTGFKVFKLDSSNIRTWEPNADDLPASLLDSAEHIKDGRSEDDILFELLLKLGLDLVTPIEDKTINGKTVHSIGAGALLVCLATSISQPEVEALALGMIAWHEEQAPAGETTVVFRDSAFADDVAKTNIAAILGQHGLTTVRSL